MEESVQRDFVDPEPLYESGIDLGTRVGLFGQHLRLDPVSVSRLQEVSDALASRGPILDVGCGLGEPLLPVGPTIFDSTSVVGGRPVVAHRLIARYGPALTVAGAVFVCTGPRHT